ncbi:oleate hydratase [Acuticoccus kandeliae]|uniref:oleate hydratase n=1 Tax=Acuticoccus kandeliae TaxID=2073160 RepID=UPI000D3E410E|nr:oleate hydratase [Acuticoccus kandeliae]
MRAYLVGSGIASLAAAATLVRDGGVLAGNVTIFEAADQPGGAMAMYGDPAGGYVLPTGRIFEEEFRCTRDLLSLVPSATNPQRSIWDDIVRFNARYGYHAKVRLLDRSGAVAIAPHLGLSPRDRLDLARLALTPEWQLDGKPIRDFFAPDFFESDFWIIWVSMMNALPQHSAMEMRRFINRFLHLFPDLATMTRIWRTPLNQYEALIEPVVAWLTRQGVKIVTGARVTDIGFAPTLERTTVNSLEIVEGGVTRTIEIAPEDLVLVTAASQTAGLGIGSMREAARPTDDGPALALWRRLAEGRPEFGHPDTFFGAAHVPDTTWVTFTVTTRDPTFFRLYSDLTAAEPGRGGLLTVRDSSWLLTTALFHQPEFVAQPADVMVWWGYALYPDSVGDFVAKPMTGCTGEEILRETVLQLGFERHMDDILANSTCIPCILPHAGTPWLVRTRADRPRVVPEGSTNFGFIGEFSEVPKEAAFTMEYAVRSAREAVSRLCGTEAPPPPYQGHHDPRALYEALSALV